MGLDDTEPTGCPENGCPNLHGARNGCVLHCLPVGSRSARQPKVKRVRSPEAQSTELHVMVQQEPGMEPKRLRLSKPQKGRVDGGFFRGGLGGWTERPWEGPQVEVFRCTRWWGWEMGEGSCLGLLPWSSPTPGRHRRARGTDRTNADTVGEAVIGHDVLVQPLDSPLPQAGAVVALVQVAQG